MGAFSETATIPIPFFTVIGSSKFGNPSDFFSFSLSPRGEEQGKLIINKKNEGFWNEKEKKERRFH